MQINQLKTMNNTDYHAENGISSSNLKLLAESPVHLKNKHAFKFSSTACDFGSLVHAMILEPETVDDEFAVMPSFDCRTKAGKEKKAEFEALSASKIIVSADDIDKATKMAENANIIAGGLLMNGVAESSHFVDDDGLILKCRPDYYIESAGVIVDIKTIADCSDFNIRKAITNYKYHWSAAWYLRVLSLLGKPAKKFVFVFVDKQTPHMVRIRELTPESLELAYLEIDQMLASYRNYLQTGRANVVKQVAIFGE